MNQELIEDNGLTDEEEAGLLEAIEELDAGLGILWDQALRQIRAEKA
jgi:hypothetical protein